MEKIMAIVGALETKLPYSETKNEAVSKAPVGWHIQHSLLVLNQVMHVLKTAGPNRYKPRFSLQKMVVYTFGKIPRGRIKAPASVQPQGAISIDALQRDFKTAKENLAGLSKLPANAFFQHPFFGKVNLKSAKIFLIIHTRHHLHIINDILA